MSLRIYHKVSKLFQPISVLPKNATVKHQDITSKSQRLMLELGIIRQAHPGIFHYLPLGVRVLDKLVKIIDKEMANISAQKVIFPALISGRLWDKSGRLQDISSELFKLEDRHMNLYLLSPTHEEVASDLLSSIAPVSYKNFPIRLYQITSKFRDEMKPRFGLMRGRQFIMKDLYTFDVDDKSAMETYEAVCVTYDKIFKIIDVDTKKIVGSTGNIGGSLSHEYHFLADIGEDTVKICSMCNFAYNTQVYDEESCRNCGNNDIKSHSGIEVGHTFLLGEKYSKPLHAQFISQDQKALNLKMGSYGLGVSRIIAAVTEVLSLDQELRWPVLLAPFTAIVIPPKEGSKEEASIGIKGETLYHSLNSYTQLNGDVLYDDRSHMTIGRRFLEARRMGYPYVIVLGKRATENPPLLEVYIAKTNCTLYLTENDLTKLILDGI